jgi:hypothetical protein
MQYFTRSGLWQCDAKRLPLRSFFAMLTPFVPKAASGATEASGLSRDRITSFQGDFHVA